MWENHLFSHILHLEMICLNNQFKNKTYRFLPLFGCLISRKQRHLNTEAKVRNFDGKVQDSLRVVENPFVIRKRKSKNMNHIEFGKWIIMYAKTLIWLYNNFYIGLILVSKLRTNIYANAEEAVEAFCKIHPYNQNKLCLPRSIFVATTSKRFKKEGVLFIGVMHPSRHMHAWIIEDGENPYKYDTIWTNFSPVALIP